MKGRKVMVLGAVGVGKTSLSHRLAFDRFASNYKATIGVDIYRTVVAVSGDTMPFILWDTDGDFGMTIFADSYLRGAAAAIVVADATRPNTIPHARQLVLGFREALPSRPCAAVLNKVDLLQDTPSMSRDAFGEPDFALAVSALTGAGVHPMLTELAAVIVRRGL